jgi:hypothetical protein
MRGSSTIGVQIPDTRAARIDTLGQLSDFRKWLGISRVQTRCGFVPENLEDLWYPGAVEAIRTVSKHRQENGQYFLIETRQETPTRMSRVIGDVGMENLAVGLDSANPVLYGKANPGDAVDIVGPPIRSINRKDGRPTRVIWAKTNARARGSSFSVPYSPSCIGSGIPLQSPSSARRQAHSRLKMCGSKKFTSKNTLEEVLA